MLCCGEPCLSHTDNPARPAHPCFPHRPPEFTYGEFRALTEPPTALFAILPMSFYRFSPVKSPSSQGTPLPLHGGQSHGNPLPLRSSVPSIPPPVCCAVRQRERRGFCVRACLGAARDLPRAGSPLTGSELHRDPEAALGDTVPVFWGLRFLLICRVPFLGELRPGNQTTSRSLRGRRDKLTWLKQTKLY